MLRCLIFDIFDRKYAKFSFCNVVGGRCLSNIFLNFQYFSGKYEEFDFYKAQILRLYKGLSL